MPQAHAPKAIDPSSGIVPDRSGSTHEQPRFSVTGIETMDSRMLSVARISVPKNSVLTQSDVAQYLIHSELISAASIVDGDLKVVEASSRNRNFKVFNDRGQSYLLKQGVGPNGRATVAHESSVYQFLEAASETASLRPHLPRCFGYDEHKGILILELLSDAQDSREYHARRGHFSTTMAATLGIALSKLHRFTSAAIARNHGITFKGRTPWVLSVHRPGLDLFRETSNANLQLIRIIQGTPEFPHMLDELREAWRVDSLIHNDIKWDNCLISTLSNSSRKYQLRIIDWEFAGMGDSSWDAGAVFSNYLSFWLFSIPVSGQEPPDRFLELARYPLDRMQPAIRAYWQAYVRGRGLDAASSEECLLRAVKYAAARLVQTGFEQMQHSMHLTGNLICLLQLSLNIMQRPYEAIVHLLGISLQA